MNILLSFVIIENTIIIDDEVYTLEKDNSKDSNVAFSEEHVISEENNNRFDVFTSEYFQGEGQATFPRRPLSRCSEVLEKFRRSRSNSIKRKNSHLNIDEPTNKKLNML